MFKFLGKLVKGLLVFIGGFVVLVCCVGAFASGDSDTGSDNSDVKTEEVVQVDEQQDTQEIVIEEPKAEVKEEVKVEPKVEVTLAQRNAVKKAESYLSFMAFSRVGLIEQLEFEGFSTEDATYAVDHVKVDWNEQCAKKAENYLDFMAFSRDGLHDQLEFEGFSEEQIQYGLQAVGY